MLAIKSTSRLTMTILGCGNMGISILRGIILSQNGVPGKSMYPINKASSNDAASRRPFFSRFIACVNRPESVLTIQNNLSATEASTVDIWQGRNLEAVQNADVILLSCQPSQAAGILSGTEMAKALSGKILLSICVGLTVPQIMTFIDQNAYKAGASEGSVIIHAMPNTASRIQESSTIISSYPEQSCPAVSEIAQHVFSSIGRSITVPSTLMSQASVTAASTPAFFALALEGVIQGAMAKGISRVDATIMAAQAMKGTAGMVLDGEDPKEVMLKVMTPNGCTERGVQVLQAGGVMNIYADAISTAIDRVIEMSREREANVA